MLLVMFDIDGTLTESFSLDGETFLEALRGTFGFKDISDDWSSYRHVTSAGVLGEIVEARLGRPPTDEENRRVQSCFRELLLPRIRAVGGVRAVRGAAEMLVRFSELSQGYAIALASGNWAATAKIVLGSAGLPTSGLPSAFSDDDMTREGICDLACHRAVERYGRAFPRVVYIGDGVWDVNTARALGYGFVGIGSGAAAEKLRAAGATEVQPDFQDLGAFLAAVERAAATLPPASSQSSGTTASAR